MQYPQRRVVANGKVMFYIFEEEGKVDHSNQVGIE
jgi:hypothetical protein